MRSPRPCAGWLLATHIGSEWIPAVVGGAAPTAVADVFYENV